MKEYTYTNHLIHETSPYLLQHAHNPVNWYAWKEEAFQKAKDEDKPILVSIGYSACHWCHVMERESFEDEATAKIMNEHFINIKIDCEERPDIDHLYMDAVQSITGSGGWPLNVFLTPDLKPFFGGTYFPPLRSFNRSSWKEVLTAVALAYKDKREEILSQSEALHQHLANANNLIPGEKGIVPGNELLNSIANSLEKLADTVWGGFGQAPKFPQTFSVIYLLRHYFFTKNEAVLKPALITLDKMMKGGIYDHLGGGFCRYSTDERWQTPHFEKMLYDNALLADAYTEAYQITKNEEYSYIVKEIFRFIKRELTSSEGGFYSSLDADSEGIEGKFYTWQKAEIDELLGEQAEMFCRVFNVIENGNWERTNILWQTEPVEKIAGELNIDVNVLKEQVEKTKKILFAKRGERIMPSLDNKVLLSWNALVVSSLCKAYSVFADKEYLESALKNIAFMEQNMCDEEGEWVHSWNKIPGTQLAFLDDYANLVQAYILLSYVTANTEFLKKAKTITHKTIRFFGDNYGCFFYFTREGQTDAIFRKTEIYDGATPSGNAVMAGNLLTLSVVFDNDEWRERAKCMLSFIGGFAEKYPTSFGVWALQLQFLIYGSAEIIILGENYQTVLQQVLMEYLPNKVLQVFAKENDEWPLLNGKKILPGKEQIYLCKNYSCLKPTNSFEEFKNQLNKHFS